MSNEPTKKQVFIRVFLGLAGIIACLYTPYYLINHIDLTEKELADIEECKKDIQARLPKIHDDNYLKRRHQAELEELNYFLENKEENFDYGWYGCDRWLKQDYEKHIAETKEPKKPVSQSTSITIKRQDYSEMIADQDRAITNHYKKTRDRLLAIASSHRIVTGNGYRIDYYTINGRQEHCTTQVYSQGPIMKCSRWPD